MFNRYSSVNDLALLKKPRKGIVPQGPDLSNFITGDADLKKLADFGLEMMKFLPKFEQLIYAGKMNGIDVTFTHGPEDDEAQVSQEWWDAFNEFNITDGEIDSDSRFACFRELRDDHGAVTRTRLTDLNGDGHITNADTIIWHENNGGADGMADWRQDWVAGQHHRVDRFGPFGSEDGSGFAGGGMGAQFKNIDFVAEGSEWNHIKQKNGKEDGQGLALADQSYFLSRSEYNTDFDFLGAIGKTWGDVKTLLETHPALAGKSFYEIAMDPAKSYQSLTAEQATLLVAAMYESRERAWQCMTEMVCPVDLTRSDRDTINYIDHESLLTKVNSYTNSHELALFPLFLYMQHSFQNQVTTFYYDRSKGDAYTLSALDDARFTDFTNWTRGKVNEYKGSLSGAAQTAVQGLYDKWFGAADVENGRPIWAEKRDITDGYDRVDVRGQGLIAYDSDTGSAYTVSYIRKPIVEHASLGWDRKWNDEEITFEDSGGNAHVQRWHGRPAYEVTAWTSLHNPSYGSQSRFNSNWAGGHANYDASQFYGLNYNSVVMGSAFANNWVVHAVGMYLKRGEGMDIMHVMEKVSKRRVVAAGFKKDMTDYIERKEELEDEKALEEKIAIQAQMRAQMEKKKANLKAAARNYNRVGNGRNNTTPPPRNNQNRTGGQNAGGAARSREEKQAFQKGLQEYNQRILAASAKRKSWLQKTKQDNQ